MAVGDIIWPFIGILGGAWFASSFNLYMPIFKRVSCAIFLFIGVILILKSSKTVVMNSKFETPGGFAGFAASLAVILSNPKAILFYLGVLPEFFDLDR